MASPDPNPNRTPMYPQINPTAPPLYPTVDTNDLHNLFPSPRSEDYSPSAPPDSDEEPYFTILGAIVHLIDTHYSVELAAGELQIIRLCQGDNTVVVLAAISDEIEWPLTKYLTAVKLDASHYFFSFQPPRDGDSSDSSDEEG